VDKFISLADAAPLKDSVADYRTAGHMLIDDAIFAPLVYGVQQYLVHPYVKGVGGNALYDFSWTDARILKH
jgi:ABC-type oligopeptide transport system substrate-binding subunit